MLLVALASLLLVLEDVLLLELTHALDFVEVDDEALLLLVKQLNAFAAKESHVLAAIKVLDPVGVLLAQLVVEGVFVLALEVKIGVAQQTVLFNDLKQNVYVEGKPLSAFKVLDQLAAHWAAHAVFVVQLRNAVGAERMPAVHEDSRDALANVVF